MIKNYFKIALRNLRKHRAFSVINITGLTVSVTFCLLLFLYIRNEQSYDTFHKNKDRLFRLEMTDMWNFEAKEPKKHFFAFLTKNDEVNRGLTFPYIVAADLKSAFPEIKNINAIAGGGTQLIKVNNQVYKQDRILYTDDNFFDTFSFHLEQGNSKTVLTSKNNIILSETIARKYFGKANPIGKTIELVTDSTQLFTVAGVAENAPFNSSIQYNFILPSIADPDYEYNIKERFNHMKHVMIVELNENVSPSQFENKMNKWVKNYFTDPFVAQYGKDMKDFNFATMHWFLRPIAECHYNISTPWGHYTNAKNIYQLTCLVIIILLIASLNYVLLAVSNAAARSQEIGVRKVMGANRQAIILQFWAETQLIVAAAVLLGLILVKVLLPLFNYAIDSDLNLGQFSWQEILLALLTLSFLLGILAGYYPALLISKMKPASIIKSFQTFKVNPRFSSILVVAQYTTCVVLIIAAFVITLQMRYVSNKNLGFDKEQIVMVENPTWDTDFTKRLHERLLVFAQREPSIVQFSGMSGGLTGGGNRNGFMLNGEQKWLNQISVDYGFFKMLGLQFIQGRPFSEAVASDTAKNVRASVVNETLFKLLDKSAKLGEYNEAIRSTIIGVVKDYHFESLAKKIEPQQHVLTQKNIQYFLFKIKPGNMQQSIAKIEKEWKQITNNYPFQYSFLDQTIAQMYEPEIRWRKTIQASAFFAVLIASMGLFGLSAINAVNRTKEIGIRKILGATVKNIVAALSKKFLLMVAIAILIAAPVAWWLMNKWLEDFAYRIKISWWIFGVASFVALLIALFTVSVQAIKAAMANPVKSLRME